MITETEAALHRHLTQAEDDRDKYREALEAVAGCIPVSWKSGTRNQRGAYEKLTQALYGDRDG